MIRIAMLGCGHVHTKGYCQAIAKRDDAKLTVVWDDMEERGKQFASEFGGEFCGDLAGAVAREDVDGFVICAPNTQHLPLLEAAVPAGRPVFCEKPFTTTVADAREAMTLIREHRATVFMGYAQPFSGAMQGVAKLLREGALGTVTHARFRNAHNAAYGHWFDSPANRWFTDPDLAGGGAFMDMGTHAVHALRTLLGPAKRVFARIGNASGVYPRVDDNGIALIEFASGVLGTVEASWVQTGGIGGLEITGSAATLYQHPQLGYVTSAPRQDPQPGTPASPRPTQVARLISVIKGELSAQEIAEDLACAADSVAIMEACYESNRTGGWVEVQKI